MIDERLLARFERVRELGADERERWLEELAGTDPAAASELRTLLAADEIEESVLERSVHPAAESGAPAPTAPDETENLNPPGTAGRPAAIPERVGPYRIVREIGRGGMGRVFLAEQVGEGFRRLRRGQAARPAATRRRSRRGAFATRRRSSLRSSTPGSPASSTAAATPKGSRTSRSSTSRAKTCSPTPRLPCRSPTRLRLFLEVLEAVDFAHRAARRAPRPQARATCSSGATAVRSCSTSASRS